MSVGQHLSGARKVTLGQKLRFPVDIVGAAESAAQLAKFNQWLHRGPFVAQSRETGAVMLEAHHKELTDLFIQLNPDPRTPVPTYEELIRWRYRISADRFADRLEEALQAATKMHWVRGRTILVDGMPLSTHAYYRSETTRQQHLVCTQTRSSIITLPADALEPKVCGIFLQFFKHN